ncbi:hypothetical protein P7C71_g6292, partial [Lecanoromycetidae sp. Uapishka_2]
MALIADGTYSIELPYDGGAITDVGEGRFLNLLSPGTLGPDVHKIDVSYDSSKGYSFKFSTSGKFVTYNGDVQMNNKLIRSDTPRYYIVEQDDVDTGAFTFVLRHFPVLDRAHQ